MWAIHHLGLAPQFLKQKKEVEQGSMQCKMLYTVFLCTPEFKLRLFYSLLHFLFIVISHLHSFDFLNILIFLLPHSSYSTHSNSDLHIFVTCFHHFTYGDNATITPHVLLLLFEIFLISIYLLLCYLTKFLLAYTSPYSLTKDLCTLLVFKQPVLVVSPQFKNQPRLTPLTFLTKLI